MSAAVTYESAGRGVPSDAEVYGDLLAEVIPFPGRRVDLNDGGQGRTRSDLHLGEKGGLERVVAAPNPGVTVMRGLMKARSWGLWTAAYVVGTVVLFVLAGFIGGALRPSPDASSVWIHSVSQGESVWQLAALVETDRSVEDVVADIYALNSLESAVIHPGQEIALPLQ